MKPTKVNFKLLKSRIDNLVITSYNQVVLYEAGEFPDSGPTYDTFPILVTEFDKIRIAYFKENFIPVREEIEQNKTIIQDINEWSSYLNEILEFYQSVDDRITEDENGKLSCPSFTLNETGEEFYGASDCITYEEFLHDLKIAVRDEYKYVMDKRDELLFQQKDIPSTRIKGSGLVWTKNINDLVELVRALKLSGSINNSTNNLTFDEAYKFFGDLFGIEIKRPEDQLRQKAESMKKLFFLEELSEVFQKDMKEMMKRRMQ